jgi:hypothetical protein
MDFLSTKNCAFPHSFVFDICPPAGGLKFDIGFTAGMVWAG